MEGAEPRTSRKLVSPAMHIMGAHVLYISPAATARRAIACKACETIQRIYRGYLARLVAEFLRVLVRRVIAAQVRLVAPLAAATAAAAAAADAPAATAAAAAAAAAATAAAAAAAAAAVDEFQAAAASRRIQPQRWEPRPSWQFSGGPLGPHRRSGPANDSGTFEQEHLSAKIRVLPPVSKRLRSALTTRKSQKACDRDGVTKQGFTGGRATACWCAGRWYVLSSSQYLKKMPQYTLKYMHRFI